MPRVPHRNTQYTVNTGFPFLKLPDNGCKYEISGNSKVSSFLFCGHPRLVGASYCAKHEGVVSPQRAFTCR